MGNYRVIIISVCILSVVALSIIVYDRHTFSKNGHDEVKAFQEFACGLGMGASVNPKWGFINFDPRIDNVDETVLFPVPGGYSYSPDTGMTVTGINEIAVE